MRIRSGKLVDLDDAARAIGDAVVVAADRHQAIVADAPFELQQRVERCGRQAPAARAARPRRPPRRPVCVVPCTRTLATVASQSCELRVEILEIAEGAGEEEVLADVAERPLDLALRLGAVRAAGPGLEAVVLRPSASSERL